MRPSHVIGPVILIALGVLFLLNNFGFGYSVGYMFRTFWPLFLIAGGAAQLLGGGGKRGSLVGGVILMGIGGVFLLSNLSVHLPFGWAFRNFWPLILIVVGVAQLLPGGGRGQWTGGVILITLGVLFFLQQMMDIAFRYTWPVLLIAAGGIGLMKAVGGQSMSFKGGYRR